MLLTDMKNCVNCTRFVIRNASHIFTEVGSVLI